MELNGNLRRGEHDPRGPDCRYRWQEDTCYFEPAPRVGLSESILSLSDANIRLDGAEQLGVLVGPRSV